jgi:hypothetical protein
MIGVKEDDRKIRDVRKAFGFPLVTLQDRADSGNTKNSMSWPKGVVYPKAKKINSLLHYVSGQTI